MSKGRKFEENRANKKDAGIYALLISDCWSAGNAGLSIEFVVTDQKVNRNNDGLLLLKKSLTGKSGEFILDKSIVVANRTKTKEKKASLLINWKIKKKVTFLLHIIMTQFSYNLNDPLLILSTNTLSLKTIVMPSISVSYQIFAIIIVNSQKGRLHQRIRLYRKLMWVHDSKCWFSQ